MSQNITNFISSINQTNTSSLTSNKGKKRAIEPENNTTPEPKVIILDSDNDIQVPLHRSDVAQGNILLV